MLRRVASVLGREAHACASMHASCASSLALAASTPVSQAAFAVSGSRGAHTTTARKPSLGVLPPLPKRKKTGGKRVFEAPNEQAPLVATHTIMRNLDVMPPGLSSPVPLLWARARESATLGAGEEVRLKESDSSTSGRVILESSGGSASSEGSTSASDSEAPPATTLPATSDSSKKRQRATFSPAKPTSFAVISLGGTQYKVAVGDIINAEHVPGAEVGTIIAAPLVHMIGTATTTLVGRPTVPLAIVRLAVEEQTVDSKMIVFKKRRRKRYQRTRGHRRMVTRFRVDSIACDVTKY